MARYSALLFVVFSTLTADAHGPLTLTKTIPGSRSHSAPGVRQMISDAFAELDDEFDTRPSTAALSKDADAHSADLLRNDAPKSHVKKPFWLTLFLDVMIFAIVAHGASRYYEESRCRDTQLGNADLSTTSKSKPSKPATFEDFMQAMQTQDEGRWRMCLQDPSILTKVDSCGCSALHVAAHCGCVEAVKELLHLGAEANAKEAWEETALHFAARAGSIHVCQLLLDHGAAIDSLNLHGHTAMFAAAACGQENTCSLLLDKGGGLGGVADSEIPPLLISLLFKRMMTPVKNA